MTAIGAGLGLVFVGLLGLGLSVAGAAWAGLPAHHNWPFGYGGRPLIMLVISNALLFSGVALLTRGG